MPYWVLLKLEKNNVRFSRLLNSGYAGKTQRRAQMVKIMTRCTKCGNDVSKTYDCEHTLDEDYCVECYTELHYYITEKKSE